ncbi:anaphase-promoting complex subunit 1-like [Zingiber officinale]|uniref:anaphase-promoting complex subunit 1-like n=1 Tax=Zingiber officinale TaxID=94328 RepID=UPI001C4BC231|nr:anaphase-promoting complex subunit 1-like [Zingiber officinale]
MSIGVRELSVLGEFKPFGLSVEDLDGKTLDDASSEHQYFLFHPEVAREGHGTASNLDFSSPCTPSEGDHEIFIRGNQIIWSSGPRVHKRYTSTKAVIMVCWCHMEGISDALLCVLQSDVLSIYGVSVGEHLKLYKWKLKKQYNSERSEQREEVDHVDPNTYQSCGSGGGNDHTKDDLCHPSEAEPLISLERTVKNVEGEDEEAVAPSMVKTLCFCSHVGRKSTVEKSLLEMKLKRPTGIEKKMLTALPASSSVEHLALATTSAKKSSDVETERKQEQPEKREEQPDSSVRNHVHGKPSESRTTAGTLRSQKNPKMRSSPSPEPSEMSSSSENRGARGGIASLAIRDGSQPADRALAGHVEDDRAIVGEYEEEHDITTVGMLLGMAASYRGTMHLEVSKMLYLHVPSRHQLSFPELELPTSLQSAALVAIGLLYEGSAHPFTMKILLGEIGRRSAGDNVLEREGYAVAAGYALGLVALGRGNDALGFVDRFVDRIFQYIGEKGVKNEKFSVVAQPAEDHVRILGQIVDGAHVNVDVTAPGGTIALALIFMKTESEEIVSRLRLPISHYDLQYVRPDFIMLRVIARNLIMWSNMQPSIIWIESQIPDFIRLAVLKLDGASSDDDEFDAEAVVQAYVNIVSGACISLGLKYAGTKSEEARELLYNYALYFLNEFKHIPAMANVLPKGLLHYVDRGTSEICLHLIILSLSLVMAGSGHLQTFRLLRYLRGRGSTEGQINYGTQMAVSLAIGFLFLGGGMQTFSTGNSAVAALLITLYPRFPTGPNDNRCHLQALRHLYVIAAESRRLQTVDVDTGLPVYCPIEITIKETEHYAESSYCEVTPCILPERCVLKTVHICGPRYWPQVIQVIPEEKPWWRFEDKSDPFNGGILYVKRKVGSCSYEDDPIGCQSLLSRAMHKVFDMTDLDYANMRNSNNPVPDSYKMDQLVSTFSGDPSLIAFAQLCCDSWRSRSDPNFQEFCSQLIFECVSKDRPALLQIYLSLYALIESMWEQANNSHLIFEDSLFLSSIKLTLAYNESLVTGKLSSPIGSIVQCAFIQSVRKHIDEILTCSKSLSENFFNYLETGKWPDYQSDRGKSDAMFLSWYLLWHGIPSSHLVKSAVKNIKSKAPMSLSMVPLLQLLFPSTQTKGIFEINKFHYSS